MSGKLRMRHQAFPDGVTRSDLLDWYRSGRARSRELFAMITPDAYYDRPIALRNPIVFYEGHLPAFCVNTLLKLALGERGIDEHYEALFARGIDPESEAQAAAPTDLWPSREEIRAYGAAADEAVEKALAEAAIDEPSSAHLAGGEAVFAILEHEQMHQETLLYLFHNLPYEKKLAERKGKSAERRGQSAEERVSSRSPDRIRVPRGRATLGMHRGEAFGWDNELPRRVLDVDAFAIDSDNVTNGQFLEFVEATGAPAAPFWIRDDDSWLLRGMFETSPLPLDAPVYVTHDQASAYARWKGGRIPTEAEYHRAAFGTPGGHERLFPWGDELPDASRGNFDFGSWDPVAAGSYPAGSSAWGIRDLVGNGWEWTSSLFDGFDGFTPMPSYPQYSVDFFDGAHYVLKGASPATARHLIRRSFRNWFRPNYPHVYATFRCAY